MSSVPKQRKYKICEFEFKKGGCRRTDCTFAHSEHELEPNVCRFGSRCRYFESNECGFFHPDLEKKGGWWCRNNDQKSFPTKYGEHPVSTTPQQPEEVFPPLSLPSFPPLPTTFQAHSSHSQLSVTSTTLSTTFTNTTNTNSNAKQAWAPSQTWNNPFGTLEDENIEIPDQKSDFSSDDEGPEIILEPKKTDKADLVDAVDGDGTNGEVTVRSSAAEIHGIVTTLANAGIRRFKIIITPD